MSFINQRPIVEFSLENRKALEAKEKRLDKSKVTNYILLFLLCCNIVSHLS